MFLVLIPHMSALMRFEVGTPKEVANILNQWEVEEEKMNDPYRSREEALYHQVRVLEEELEDTKEDLRRAEEAKNTKGYKFDPFIFAIVFCFMCSLLMTSGISMLVENKIAGGLITGAFCLLISGIILGLLGSEVKKFK